MLYIGTEQGIEVLNTTNVSDKKVVVLDKEFSTTDILLSKDKEKFKESTIKQDKTNSNTSENNKNTSSTETNKDVKKDKEESKTESKESKEVNTLYVLNTFANDNKNSIVMKFQEGVPVDILELEKENPISMFEGDKYLYVTCRGLETDKEKDSMILINKKNFKIKKRVVLENVPNFVSIIDENTAFVSHDEGEVVRVELSNGTSDGIFKIINAESSLIKKYSK